MSNTVWWAIMRSSGLTAWVFLTLTVAWGALVSGRLVRGSSNRQWLLDLHPYLGAIGLGAVVLHIVAAVMDTTVHLHWINTIVPMTSTWKPIGVSMGVLSLWTLAIVEVTSLVRRRMRKKVWHAIHLSSYGMAWVVTLHAILNGTDVHNKYVAWTGVAMVVGATTIAVRRWIEHAPRPIARRYVGDNSPAA